MNNFSLSQVDSTLANNENIKNTLQTITTSFVDILKDVAAKNENTTKPLENTQQQADILSYGTLDSKPVYDQEDTSASSKSKNPVEKSDQNEHPLRSEDIVLKNYITNRIDKPYTRTDNPFTQWAAWREDHITAVKAETEQSTNDTEDNKSTGERIVLSDYIKDPVTNPHTRSDNPFTQWAAWREDHMKRNV